MLKPIPKIFLVASSVAPVLLTLAFLAWRADRIKQVVILLVATVAIVLTTKALLLAAARKFEEIHIRIEKARSADKEVIGFLLAYVLPLALTNPQNLSVDAWSVVFLVTIFVLVVWGTHAYDFNPLLGLLRYHFFEVEADSGVTYVVVTRKPIVSVQQITKVVQLTEYVLLDIA